MRRISIPRTKDELISFDMAILDSSPEIDLWIFHAVPVFFDNELGKVALYRLEGK